MKHGIQLVFAKRDTICATGERLQPMDVAVTCECYRIGKSDGFHGYIGLGSPIPEAWRRWNVSTFHREPETFVKDEQMTLIHGLYQ